MPNLRAARLPPSLTDLSRALDNARRERRPIRSAGATPVLTESEAYAVSRDGVAKRVERGERVVGAKIGLTAEPVRAMVGASEPDFGLLTDAMRITETVVNLADKQLIEPRLEVEMAFLLRADLEGRSVGPADVLHATEAIFPAFEVVDSRYEGWRVSLAETIADNASSAYLALGDRFATDPRRLNLRQQQATLLKNGEVVARGRGDSVFGSPTEAVAWLARALAVSGEGLAAGDIILSGSLIPPHPVVAGDAFEAVFEGHGGCHLRFD